MGKTINSYIHVIVCKQRCVYHRCMWECVHDIGVAVHNHDRFCQVSLATFQRQIPAKSCPWILISGDRDELSAKFPQHPTWMALYSLSVIMCRWETTHPVCVVLMSVLSAVTWVVCGGVLQRSGRGTDCPVDAWWQCYNCCSRIHQLCTDCGQNSRRWDTTILTCV